MVCCRAHQERNCENPLVLPVRTHLLLSNNELKDPKQGPLNCFYYQGLKLEYRKFPTPCTSVQKWSSLQVNYNVPWMLMYKAGGHVPLNRSAEQQWFGMPAFNTYMGKKGCHYGLLCGQQIQPNCTSMRTSKFAKFEKCKLFIDLFYIRKHKNNGLESRRRENGASEANGCHMFWWCLMMIFWKDILKWVKKNLLCFTFFPKSFVLLFTF